jgi:hypothetical protein
MATADAATLFVETTLGTRIVVSFLTSATTVADFKRAFSPRFLLHVGINRRLLPSALAGIDRRLLLGSTVGSCRRLLLGSTIGFCWDRPQAAR